jgi:hypothetical protein
MRLVGTGLFVFTSMLLLVGLLSSQKVFDQAPSWVVGLVIAVFVVGMAVLSLWLLNPRGSDPFGRKTDAERIRELEQVGQLESLAFRATRRLAWKSSRMRGSTTSMIMSRSRTIPS